MTAQETDMLLPDNGSAKSSSRPISKGNVVWILMTVLFAISTLVLLFLDVAQRPAAKVNRRYRATQFLSFTINTMGGLADKGECDGRIVDAETNTCYLGNENITKDALHRLKIVDAILKTCIADSFVEVPSIDHSDDVLKILMLPEFFMRGPHGAYSTKLLLEDGLLIHMGDKIRSMISHEEFSDYLFVFGTVIAASSPSGKAWEQDSDEAVDYLNFAPVYMGGPSPDHHYLVAKKYISTGDFLRRVRLPNPAEPGDYDHRLYDELPATFKNLLEKRNVTIVPDNLLEIDNINIGLEICLDHRMGRLWSNLQAHHHGQLVDVQLIISAGMSIERGPNAIVPGGVVYLTDGEAASSAACMRTSTGKFEPEHVCREVVNGVKHLPTGGAGYSNFFTMSACMDVDQPELYDGYYSRYQPQGCANTLSTYGIHVFNEFSQFPVSLEIYPAVDLPVQGHKIL